jgi:hypothetical protein
LQRRQVAEPASQRKTHRNEPAGSKHIAVNRGHADLDDDSCMEETALKTISRAIPGQIQHRLLQLAKFPKIAVALRRSKTRH